MDFIVKKNKTGIKKKLDETKYYFSGNSENRSLANVV